MTAGGSGHDDVPGHLPVLYAQTLDGLRVTEDGTYLDGTFGRGGHARGVLGKLGAGGRLLLMDKDPEAIAVAEREFGADPRVSIRRGSFAGMADWDATAGGLDGVLLDLGVSSLQLDAPERGFSFQRDEPLDMRMDPSSPETAADIVNTYSEEELASIIREYGEERRARVIARAIVARRPIHTTRQLVDAIEQAVGRGRERQIHPATLTFQALRIAVNRELDSLVAVLPQAHGLLDRVGGRLVVISFHSLEDREVKNYLRRESTDCLCPPRTPVCICGHVATLRLVGRLRRPSDTEVAANPRARSAKLRAVERL